MEPGFWIDLAALLSQIAFYAVMATVAILTYRRARATILQPIRTEIFKAQADLLRSLLPHVVGKSTADLMMDFGFPRTIEGNMMKMAGAYGILMFDWENRQPTPWSGPDFPQGISSLRAWTAGDFTEDEHPDVRPDRPSPSPPIRLSKWLSYIHDDLVLSSSYCDKIKELELILHSPLLPVDCAHQLEHLLTEARQNVFRIGEALTAAKNDFPEHFRTSDELKNAHFLWLHNRCVASLIDLAPIAASISATIRRYFAPDALTSLDWPPMAAKKSR